MYFKTTFYRKNKNRIIYSLSLSGYCATETDRISSVGNSLKLTKNQSKVTVLLHVHLTLKLNNGICE